MLVLSFTLFCLSTYHAVKAGSQKTNETCSQGNNKLQTGTYQFWSDCDSVNYCTDQGICRPKGCRKDDFPFGYPQDSDEIPPKCPNGQFCPDEASSCQPLQPVGSPCQLNRDDECERPPNFSELADKSGRGLNSNGSVCINNICLWANVSLGNSCEVENTAYIAYGKSGEFIDIVSRDNCRLGLYCDAPTKVCLQSKNLGVACGADKECDSWNCLSTGVCGVAAATPHHFGIWVYAVVALGIFGGMAGTLGGLFVTHRKQREQEREKRIQYWREQNAFHQNLQQMRETARASILSLPHNGGSARSTLYGSPDELNSPVLQNAATKSSGLRHYVGDDGSSDYEERVTMHNRRADGRF